jgi:hypothetical protein
MRAVRERYGASAWHLAGHLATLAVIVIALWELLPGGGLARVVNIVAWLVAGAILHDFVGLPLYAAVDRGARRATRSAPRVLNHLRVPAAIAGVLFLVYFPLILVKADGNFHRATGHHIHGYGRNWLLITAGLFAASGLIYAARAIAGRRGR